MAIGNITRQNADKKAVVFVTFETMPVYSVQFHLHSAKSNELSQGALQSLGPDIIITVSIVTTKGGWGVAKRIRCQAAGRASARTCHGTHWKPTRSS